MLAYFSKGGISFTEAKKMTKLERAAALTIIKDNIAPDLED